ncbi:hypothetical protein RYX36_010070 [Vicia faba]
MSITFKDKLIKFNYYDSKKFLDLNTDGALVDVIPAEYGNVSHVLAISKSVVESPGMSLLLERVKEDLRVEMKDEILPSKGRVAAQIKSMNAFGDYMGSNNYIFHSDSADTASYILVPVPDELVAPYSTFDPFDVFPSDLP